MAYTRLSLFTLALFLTRNVKIEIHDAFIKGNALKLYMS